MPSRRHPFTCTAVARYFRRAVTAARRLGRCRPQDPFTTPEIRPALFDLLTASPVRCDDRRVRAQHFTTTVADDGRGGALIPVPFDPDQVWGSKSRHHVTGTINGMRTRSVVEPHGEVCAIRVGPAWLRDHALAVGDEADVEIEPEGPQRDDLADDVAAALAANPAAGEFFDSLAQFYRRGYLRWIDATKRSPDLRKLRIATMIDLLEAGVKDYRARSS
jgi:hypothetical protein